MRKIREILALKHEVGLPVRSIARAVHASTGTVSEYLSKAKEQGVSWPLPAGADDEHLEAMLFPPREGSDKRHAPDFARMHEELRRHRDLTLLQLWVKYAKDYPGAYRYSRFCELYLRWKKKLNPRWAQGIVRGPRRATISVKRRVVP